MKKKWKEARVCLHQRYLKMTNEKNKKIKWLVYNKKNCSTKIINNRRTLQSTKQNTKICFEKKIQLIKQNKKGMTSPSSQQQQQQQTRNNSAGDLNFDAQQQCGVNRLHLDSSSSQPTASSTTSPINSNGTSYFISNRSKFDER